MSFERLGLSAELLAAVNEQGYTRTKASDSGYYPRP